jgi:hypothetical protein
MALARNITESASTLPGPDTGFGPVSPTDQDVKRRDEPHYTSHDHNVTEAA